MDRLVPDERRRTDALAPDVPLRLETLQTPSASQEMQTSLSARRARLFRLSECANAARRRFEILVSARSRRRFDSLPRGLRQPSALQSSSASGTTVPVVLAPHAGPGRATQDSRK